MTATDTRLRTLTTFLPVADAGALRAAIAALPRGERGPFARGGRTHVARMIVLDDLVGQPGVTARPDHLSRPYLLFSAVVDVPGRAARDPLGFYVPLLVAEAGAEVAAVFRYCEGYPCPGREPIPDAADLVRWMRAHELPAGLEVMADRTAPVGDIVDALALRAQVKELAVKLRGASAAEVRVACEAAFPQLWRRRPAGVPAAVGRGRVEAEAGAG